MCLKFLKFVISFFFYVCKRSICGVKQLLSHSSRWFHLSGNRDRSFYRRVQYDAYLLENKSFSDMTRILFLPINQELRLFNGSMSAQWTLIPEHIVQSTQNSLSAKTTFLMDGLKFSYEGMLKFMNFEFEFKSTVHLENVNIFTELTVNPHGSKIIANNIYIDSMKFKLIVLDHTLCNTTNNSVLPRFLKIVFSFILCLVEFSMRSHLNLKFESIDAYKPFHKPCFKSVLADHIERAENEKNPEISAAENVPFTDENCPITKSFISVLHTILVEENRKTLVPILRNILNPEQKPLIADVTDEGQVSEHDTESLDMSELEGSSEHNPNEHELNELESNTGSTIGESENSLDLVPAFANGNSSNALVLTDEDSYEDGSQEEGSSEEEDSSQEEDSSEEEESSQNNESNEDEQFEEDDALLENGDHIENGVGSYDEDD